MKFPSSIFSAEEKQVQKSRLNTVNTKVIVQVNSFSPFSRSIVLDKKNIWCIKNFSLAAKLLVSTSVVKYIECIWEGINETGAFLTQIFFNISLGRAYFSNRDLSRSTWDEVDSAFCKKMHRSNSSAAIFIIKNPNNYRARWKKISKNISTAYNM